jgi:hypothetical protein
MATPITKKLNLTINDIFNIRKLTFEPVRGAKVITNPINFKQVNNTYANRKSIKKQVDIYNENLMNKLFTNANSLNTIEVIEPVKTPRTNIVNLQLKEQALYNFFNTFIIENNEEIENFEYLKNKSVINALKSIIKSQYRKLGQLHINIRATVNFFKNNVIDLEPIFFVVNSRNVLSIDEIDDKVNEQIDLLEKRIEDFQGRGSGINHFIIRSIDININKYKPLTGSSYIPTPKKLASKKAIINVQNEDNKCFMYSVLSALHTPEQDAQRVSKYSEFIKLYNWEGIEFPTPINQISKFEKKNNISIYVYSYDDKDEKVRPIKTNKEIKEKHINLLLLHENDNTHYTYIKDFSRLTGSQCNKHKGKIYPCFLCQHPCSSQETLEKHQLWCKEATKSSDGIIKMPKPGETLKFKNFYNKFKAPFVIYSDFEAILPKITTVNRTEKLTENTKHIPCGFCLYVVSDFDKFSFEPYVYRGQDCMTKFYKKLDEYSRSIYKILKMNEKMILTDDDLKNFNKSINCHICEQPLNGDKVKDHCHITGKYRGASHNNCNINFNYKHYKIPVIIHNLKNYDAHFIISCLNNKASKYVKINPKTGEVKEYNKQLKVIANNSEKYMTFSIGNLKFIDSFQFLSSSLDELSKNLSFDDFTHTKKLFGKNWEIAKQKGIYPYEYMDSFDKFEEEKLPSIESFYSNLNESNITEDEYEHAQNVWKTINMKNLGDYHDFYLKTDVVLLADVFETFRNTIHKTHKLDPIHYITLPSFSWDAMLYYTKVELDLLDDYEMLCMFEKGIRGGISVISHRYAKANNKYMNENYNPSIISSYITYLDANNLYALAMSEKLPYKNFKWVDVDKFNMNQIQDDSNIGYLLEVDLEYPKELHDLHNDYPLAPESMTIANHYLSEKQIERQKYINKEMNKSSSNDIQKLAPNLYDKTKYVVHYKNLKYYIEKGLVLKKIHRVIQYEQSDFLKKYIDLNTDLRKKSKNDFEKDLYKLMNNSVFGKTMENIRGRIDLELVNNEKRAKSITTSPLYNSFNIINQDLVSILSNRKETHFCKPIYIGQAILDLSKLHMFKFHYETIKPFYGDKVKLLGTDTDSLMYHIETDDLYEDMKKNIDLYDTSDYPKNHKLYSEKNKKVIGKFKDELKAQIIEEMVLIRSKVYSLKVYGTDKTKGVLKGVKKSYYKNHITHDNYVKCINRY